MSGVRSFPIIQRRLLLLFIAAIGITLVVVFVLNTQQANYIKNSNDLGAILNQSGRQRMLSQWLTKEIIIAEREGFDVSRKNKIDSVLVLFRKTHELLYRKSVGLKNNELDKLFDEVEAYHARLVLEVQAFYQQDSSSKPVFNEGRLLSAESQFLPLMDEITGQFEVEESKILQRINKNVIYSSVVIAILVVSLGGVVLYITLSIIRNYAQRLYQVSDKLKHSLKNEQSRVEKLQFLTDTIKVGIWEKDLKDSTEKWSSRLYEILGFTPKDYQGTWEEFISLVHPTDLPKLNEAGKQSFATQRPTTLELRVKNASDEYIWVEASGNVRKNNDGELELMVGGVLEITDRKLLEVQLKSFIARAPAAIAMFDLDMKYLAASHKWMEDYHLQGREIIGISHYEIFPEIGDDWKEIHQRCLKGDVEINEEDPFNRADGSVQYLKWEVRPWYRSDDEIGGILMFTEDVTQIIYEKEELRRAKQDAEQAARSKEDFLATMSHEIRTPLNAIIGISHILMMENPKPEQLEQIKLLRFSGENLLSLINDILDISKINSGKIVLSLGRFDLRYIIENIRNTLAFKAKENLVDISVYYDTELPTMFVGDVTRITQIMNNLVSNAIKFTNQGIVRISVDMLSSDEEKSRFKISVIDNGIGIDPANHQKIFNSFEQAEEGTTRRFGGTGLGLFITKKLIELMGSSIQLESAPGKGSTFYFELELPNASNDHQDSNNDLRLSAIERLNLNVLVAEDNLANQLIVIKYLNTAKITHDVVSDGQQALKLIESEEYDMVFMDLQMPVMDGYVATREIRKKRGEYFQKVPIIALTADAFVDIQDQTRTIGMSDFLSKPFRPSSLYDIIRRNVGQVVPKKRSINIEESLNSQAQGDDDFKHTFSQRSLEAYLEFYQGFNQLLVQPDADLLKMISHKIKSLNATFQLDKLQAALDELIALGQNFVQKRDLINRVLFLAKEAIDELRRFSREKELK